MFFSRAVTMIEPEQALPGRTEPAFDVPGTHRVLGTPLRGPWPEGTQVLYVAMGCFWGEEKHFWEQPGVVTTAVGYMGGFTPNPTYEETCTGRTGHTETVMVAYDPSVVSTERLLEIFWTQHDPTQVFRQGNDQGTQYRSAVYWTTPQQRDLIERTKADYQPQLTAADYGAIATEIRSADDAGPFFYAEGYHQQYLVANPNGYCPVHATGVTFANA
ncbi:peptide methionine sulfoxide reductase [Beutenbergia cavernae DSM 12333]|uniref:Peptide methionine sulfoxide reductase MsrA n=1 Tax=Beutenbergia cavernae (strain ATCC BAA-8 / DSM 12333 / CCUG 43141 / JCM 11478 / NBRC 16432 / NCIMB 13614 / HKI 0122) TaxID=471853 RepID=C5C0E8_BEUC1|nr:peptide-methionine (S)-S-oxide reductase MsrA [Beutenbergia cavernae]ACQ79334.1 peptide methionine sulfoxide reductase [Beutenbergia cavernae DSM 12333]